jgi:hypothetical protein
MPAVSPGGRAARRAPGGSKGQDRRDSDALDVRVKSAGYLAPALAVIRGRLQVDCEIAQSRSRNCKAMIDL